MQFRLTECWVVLLLVLLPNQRPAYIVSHQQEGNSATTTQPLWRPADYPHPDRDARRCRTFKNRLCDPDYVLTERQIRTLEDELDKDRRVPCQHHDAQQQPIAVEYVQLQIGVALVEQMDLSDVRHLPESQREMTAAQHFATTVHNDWGVGHSTLCGDTGILLFLSVTDRAVYISRGSALEATLTSRRIRQVVQTAMKPYLRDGDYAGALHKGLAALETWIAKGPAPPEEGQADAVAAAVVTGGVLALFGWASWQSHQRQLSDRNDYARVERELRRLDRIQAQLHLQHRRHPRGRPPHTSTATLTSAEPTATLHPPAEQQQANVVVADDPSAVYDPLQQHTQDEATDHPVVYDPREAEQLQEGALEDFRRERNDRLRQLRSDYPRLVPNELYDQWMRNDGSTSLAKDPAFVRLNPRVQALERQHNRTQSSSSSGFGGGRSSGGAGGQW